MKIATTLALLAILSLSACIGHDATVYSSQADSLQQNFMPVIRGMWVETRYMDDLEKTKSPFKSYDKISYGFLDIHDSTSTDSLEVLSSRGYHEGYNFFLYFKPGQLPNSLAIAKSEFEDGIKELQYEIKGKDTFLLLNQYDKTGKLIEKTRFSKLRKKQVHHPLTDGFQFAVNRTVFAGTYTITPKIDTLKQVQFSGNGGIKGLPGFRSYYIQTDFGDRYDYAGDKISMNPMDQVSITQQDRKNDSTYTFEVNKDTINLYYLIKKENEDKAERGPLKYKFIKIKE